MRMFKITLSELGNDSGCVVSPDLLAAAIEGELENLETGESITLTVVEMSQEEFDALPEFQGW